MKIKAIFKNSKKAITVIAALSLLLAFSQCKKDKEDDENFELACDASEYINNNLQSQLDLLSDKTTPEAMEALAEWMKGQEGVSSAVPFNDRVEYVYVDGTKGSIMVYNQPDEDDLDDSRWSLMPTVNRLQRGNVVGNHKCFIYDAFPYTSSNYNPGDTIQKRFEDRGYECVHPRSEECTIDTLKAMFQYGFVMIKTHTNSDVFATGEKVTRRKRELYRESMENDLIREANLVIKEGWLGFEHKDDFFGVTSKYIEGLQGEFDNTIVFMGACLGFPDENALLKDAFLHRHAATYFGFNNTVVPRITCRTSDWIVLNLFEGLSVGEAYNTIYFSELGNCFDFEHEGKTITTCLEIAGRRDIVWYEDPNAPSVTTHEVQPGSIATTTATVSGSVVFPDPSQPIEYERGFVYGTSSEGLVVGEADQVVYPGSDLLNFSCTLTGLLPNTTYFVKAYSRWENNRVIYGNMVSFTTLDGSGPDPGNHEYVDLGLPSGLLWATCNVGANSPEEYGDYFAWGETQPKDYYDWSTYQHCMGSYNTLTKYCDNSIYGYNGYTDDLTTLLPEDDAATANWGSGWRMPTQEECEELCENTTSTWTTQNGVSGRLYTAPNGNSLFLPAAGDRWVGELGGVGSHGYYWSNSFPVSGPTQPWCLHFGSGSNVVFCGGRGFGRSVRPVLGN